MYTSKSHFAEKYSLILFRSAIDSFLFAIEKGPVIGVFGTSSYPLILPISSARSSLIDISFVARHDGTFTENFSPVKVVSNPSRARISSARSFDIWSQSFFSIKPRSVAISISRTFSRFR